MTTDVLQIAAMVIIAAVVVPVVVFHAGGPAEFAGGLGGLSEQGEFFSLGPSSGRTRR